MRAIPLLLTFATALVARDARADDLRLAWRAPPGCPTETQVRASALRAPPPPLPEPPTSAPATPMAAREPLIADVLVDHGDRWTVTIRTKRAGLPAAERRLDATSCEALAEATALILAMALVQPAEAAPASAPGPASTPGPASAPAPTSAAAPASLPAPASAAGPDRASSGAPPLTAYARVLAASAALATDSTTLPSPALGGRAGFAWTPNGARLEVAGAYFSAQSRTTGNSPAGAELSLLVAGARGCWAVVRSAVELSPCAGADLHVVQARGYGAAANYDASAAWLSAAGGALVRLPLADWLALRGDVDAIVPFSRPRFVVEGDGAVHRSGSLGVRAGIGAELLFL